MANLLKPIYLDYAATTPVDERVLEKMMGCLSKEGIFGNAASAHVYGVQAKESVAEARHAVASLVSTVARNIIFTSGATEANNLAIKGAALSYQKQGKHIVTLATEHSAVLDPCRYLEQLGFEVTYLKPRRDGILELDKLENALRKETILVSIMHVNNETGIVQDIGAFGALTRARAILLHVDAAQSAGKVPINVQTLKVDLMSFSAHKVYGPKGIGALYIGDTPRVKLLPQLHGGGQERKIRAGTLPVHQIVGLGESFRIAKEVMAVEAARIQTLREKLWNGIKTLPNVYLNGHIDPTYSAPGILNVCFSGITKNQFWSNLSGLAISNAAACNSISLAPSHVLKAMGLSDEAAECSFRFSLGRFTTEQEIEETIQFIRNAL
jgi:cysteine desulfurase